MSEYGHIKISRKAYAADPFWNEAREFSKWEAWEWMIQEAAFRDRRRVVGGVVVDLLRGEFLASLRFMAQAWGWSVKKVRGFVEQLQGLGRIRAQREAQPGTVYLLVNYDAYQSTDTGEGTAGGTSGAQRGHSEGTARAQTISSKAGEAVKKEDSKAVLKLHASDPLEKSIDEIMVAANRGMIDNPLIGDACQSIPVGHGSRQNVHDWLAEGIPAEVAKLAVYQRAKEWKPDGRRRQITTLAYFDGAVRDEADKHRAKSGEAPTAKAPGVDRSEVGEWKRANPAELADIERQENERLEQNDTYTRTSAGVRRTMLQDAVKAAVQKRIRAATAVA